jgi:predicted DNA-binding protein (MmcQ/YjbR family)
MTRERVRQLCLTQPGATEPIQWGADAVVKVGGKMFAVACTDFTGYPDANVCSFKCDDEGFAELCEREDVVPAPYLARAKWVSLAAWSALSDREITERVGAAYAIVRGGLPKRVQAELPGASPAPAGRRPAAGKRCARR